MGEVIQDRLVAPLHAGVARLLEEPEAIINGLSGTRALTIVGTDATASAWVDRVTGTSLAITGSGAAPDLAQPGAWCDGHSGVKFKGTGALGDTAKTYVDGGAKTCGDVALQDMLIEALIAAPVTTPTTSAGIARKSRGDAGSPGWSLAFSGAAGGNVNFNISDDGVAFVSPTAALGLGQLGLVHGFVNRNEASANGMRVYANAAGGTGLDPTAASSTMTSTYGLAIGGGQTQSYGFGGFVFLVNLWLLADWFAAGAGGEAQAAAWAKRRCAMLFGAMLPHHPTGDSNRVPTVL